MEEQLVRMEEEGGKGSGGADLSTAQLPVSWGKTKTGKSFGEAGNSQAP